MYIKYTHTYTMREYPFQPETIKSHSRQTWMDLEAFWLSEVIHIDSYQKVTTHGIYKSLFKVA